jgi:hypothetical protein
MFNKGTLYKSDFQILRLSGALTETYFRFKNCSQNMLNIVFEPPKKIEIVLQKLLPLTAHAAKALIEKVWNLADQEIVETTNPAGHRAGLLMPETVQKEHLHQEEILPPLQIKPRTNRENDTAANAQLKRNHFHHRENLTREKGKMTENQAALVQALQIRLHFPQGKNHTPAEQLTQNHPAKGSRLVKKAGHTRADLPIVILIAVTTGLKDPRRRLVVNPLHHAVNSLRGA